MITGAEFIILLRIFAAHLVADFFLQPRSWVQKKKAKPHSRYLYFHAAIVGILTYLFLADWSQWILPLFIAMTHFLIDWWKSARPKSLRYYVIDQCLHLLMLFIAWFWYIHWQLAPIVKLFYFLKLSSFWIILVGYLLMLRPIGLLIARITTRWEIILKEKEPTYEGLKNAGAWIGYIERVIILTLILIGQYSAIGFLIAAKSIFRFSGGVKSDQERQYAEYILIGTLLSYVIAILCGICIRYLLSINS